MQTIDVDSVWRFVTVFANKDDHTDYMQASKAKHCR